MKGLVVSTDREDYLMLFRTHVSRNAAGKKARAVLEGVGLGTSTIAACFSAHPSDDEEAVQDGLSRWAEGHGRQPLTWSVLVKAMKYAQIAIQDVEALQEALGH